MATGTNIKTYFDGTWHDGDLSVIKAADHGAWLGTTVFDGARLFDGLSPDLQAHCARINRSARALMITPTVETADMVAMVREGLASYPREAAVYIRPMYWALAGDELGIVAESASANAFMVMDGEVFTPIPNGTFLAGITRARHMKNMTADGMKVHETVLSFDDFHAADEVFLSGNMMKVTPVKAFDHTQYQIGPNANPVTRRVREMYWDWAASERR